MSYTTTEKALSLDWNGKEFIMTLRNEITGEYSYKTSLDGSTWTNHTFNTGENINANFVRAIGNTTVLGGQGIDSSNGLAIANNGIEILSFSNVKTNPYIFYDLEANLEHPHTITFHKHVCLAVGGGSLDTVKIAYSLDGGTTWIRSNTTVFTEINDVVWNGSLWVGVGGSVIATSANGIQWTARENVTRFSSLKTVAWSDKTHKFICGGVNISGINAASSIDGIHWKYLSIPLTSVEKIACNGDIWVAIGTPISGTNSVAYSLDGVVWNAVTQTPFFLAKNIIWSGDKWFASGTDSSFNLATSIDGISWSLQTVPAVGNIRAIYARKDSLVYYSDNSGVYSLRNGLQIPNILVDKISYSPATLNYLLGRSDGRILTSLNMSSITATIDASLTSVKSFGVTTNQGIPDIKPLSLACGEGTNTTMAYSEDGIEWKSLQKTVFSTRCNQAAWNGEKWVAVGAGVGGWVATSQDAISWVNNINVYLTEGFDIAWNGERWVACGNGGIMYSPNGLDWFTALSEAVDIQVGYRVQWTGSVWTVYGNKADGTPLTVKSVDGINWSSSGVANIGVGDVSNALWQSGFLTGYNNPTFGIDVSSATVTVGNEAWRLFDGLSTTKWVGLASGDFVTIDLSGTPFTLNHYALTVDRNDASSIPQKWNVYGSNDTTWTLIDAVDSGAGFPPSGGIAVYFFVVDNSLAFSKYKLEFVSNRGAINTRLAGWDIYIGKGPSLTRNIQPVLNRNCIMHSRKIGLDGVTRTAYYLTDLSLNPVKNYNINGYSSGIIDGLSGELITAFGFNGDRLLVASSGGRLAYMSNAAAITNLAFDVSVNLQPLVSNLTTVNSSCFNTKYILLGGSGGVRYHELRENVIPQWKNTNVGDFMTTVYGVASNSPYGFVYNSNKLYFRQGEQLSIVSTKHNYVPVPTNVAISMQLLS